MEIPPRNTMIPREALAVCRRIAANGHDVYVVGGAVRDFLLGFTPPDIDLATSATPQQVQGCFAKVIPSGIAHGTVTVLEAGRTFEVTTLRGEGSYSDGRRPDSVVFLTDIREDLARRDFTINAMAYDPIRGVFHDPFDGRGDLDRRCLRAVGKAEERFREDGLRLLRAARFAAVLEFDIEPMTSAALGQTATALGAVSPERKRDEMTKMLLAARPSLGLKVLKQGHLLPFAFHPWAGVGEDAHGAALWASALNVVDTLPRDIKLRLAALLIMAKDAGTQVAPDAWLKSMRFDNAVIRDTCHLLPWGHGPSPAPATAPDVRRRLREMGKAYVDGFFTLWHAMASLTDAGPTVAALHAFEGQIREALAQGVPLGKEDLAINGNDLMRTLGLPPGPHLKKILDALVDHVLEHPENNTPDQLLAHAANQVTTADSVT